MSEDTKPSYKIAVLGGTGAEGSGLAYRWSRAGCEVVIGSRDPARAQACAAELMTLPGAGAVRGASNEDAAKFADIVVLTVPYAAQQSTVLPLKDALRGKILVDVTVPLKPPKVDRVSLPSTGSVVAALQNELGAETRVVGACQNVSAHHLKDPHHQIDCDVLICGDDAQACDLVVALTELAGLRGIHAGPVANSAAAEAMTSLLIFINKKYKVKGSGIRITGLPA
ncbi:reduced coenzyme F420:NADP oxidoreductase [Panacagrimonas perspica]|uniref:Reduced coenzyme F420:NADP oxidoreductase n=1 Tax=Panacagrimonas perspica TaxID=381431 RepID=A0A4R7NT17_9GAMM|nr:NADPH-dependent F420 reductase [Panacagrimonas perspica]TDU24203.1 reduced coenzyme F420:NADP oxidoreductase [Panacagrimonas perspica]THD04614.1 NADPH-dependent F420 reductase [Panacagrimonas perspica]